MQVQHMMERYDYTSRTARLRNRIAIPYHQNSKHESLPTGCLFRFMFFPQAIKTTGFIRAIRFIRVLLKHIHPCSIPRLNTKHYT